MKARIENFRFPDLRHAFATNVADAGTDVFTRCSMRLFVQNTVLKSKAVIIKAVNACICHGFYFGG
jgi:hypothetical protein